MVSKMHYIFIAAVLARGSALNSAQKVKDATIHPNGDASFNPMDALGDLSAEQREVLRQMKAAVTALNSHFDMSVFERSPAPLSHLSRAKPPDVELALNQNSTANNVHITTVMTLCCPPTKNGPYWKDLAKDVVRLVYRRLPVQSHKIFYCKAVEDHIRELFRDTTEFPGLEVTPMGGQFYNMTNWTWYSKWMTSWDFWNAVQGDKVLIYQPDAHICNDAYPLLKNFLQYDYVGSPWDHDSGCASGVGNGGFSLRDIKAAKKVLEQNPHAMEEVGNPDIGQGLAEDVWWCKKFSEGVGYKVPSKEEARLFSNGGSGMPPTTHLVGAHDVENFEIAEFLESGCEGLVDHMHAYQDALGEFRKEVPVRFFQEETHALRRNI